MLTEARKWVDAAYKEGPNNETPFGRWYGDDNEPWCDQFVSYVGDASGNGDAVGRFEYCPSHVEWFKNQGRFGSDPIPGALVFYSWNGDGVADHVGIVVGISDSEITTYEGNTSSGQAGSQGNGDGAYERTRPRNWQILGYGYPNYPADAVSPAPAPPVPAPSGPSAPPFPGEYLRLRSPMMHDDNVRAWQQRMSDRGWHISVDGWFGSASRDVAVAFQNDSTANGWPLDADGIVGPATWRAAWERPVS
ncbi:MULTISPECIES: CHAP domain-containing protein [unclassified Kitasatospora]|uniref:C40 family peptidase n=1 Tax=unclassified Kitasatospora TaxID=2633591 RepID=UPI002475844D|nr:MULTISPECIES: CHAP domain-containing protein [unclassified Kitasatospora]